MVNDIHNPQKINKYNVKHTLGSSSFSSGSSSVTSGRENNNHIPIIVKLIKMSQSEETITTDSSIGEELAKIRRLTIHDPGPDSWPVVSTVEGEGEVSDDEITSEDARLMTVGESDGEEEAEPGPAEEETDYTVTPYEASQLRLNQGGPKLALDPLIRRFQIHFTSNWQAIESMISQTVQEPLYAVQFEIPPVLLLERIRETRFGNRCALWVSQTLTPGVSGAPTLTCRCGRISFDEFETVIPPIGIPNDARIARILLQSLRLSHPCNVGFGSSNSLPLYFLMRFIAETRIFQAYTPALVPLAAQNLITSIWTHFHLLLERVPDFGPETMNKHPFSGISLDEIRDSYVRLVEMLRSQFLIYAEPNIGPGISI